MRVVGGFCPSIPMRTVLTPSLPTAMRVWPVTFTVPGKSTTTRSGESRVLSFGVTAPLEFISIRMSPVPRTTLTRSSWPGVWAAAAPTTNHSVDTNSVSCFRISPLPNPRAWLARPSCNLISAFPVSGPAVLPAPLNRRGQNSLYHFPRHRLAQLVLYRLLEHHRITRDLHHVAVKYRVVLSQKVGFVQIVGHDRDEAVVGLHHSADIDVPDLQAFLARRASRTVLLNHRAEERIPFPVHRPLLVLLLRLGAICRFERISRRRVRGHKRRRWRC